MLIGGVIGIAVLLLALWIGWIIFKNIIKAAILAIIVLIAGTFIVGAAIFSDASALSDGMMNDDKLFLLEIDNKIAAGLTVGKIQDISFNDAKKSTLQQDQIDAMTGLFHSSESKEAYAEMLGDKFKLFIFHEDCLESIPDSFTIEMVADGPQEFEKAFILGMMDADDPVGLYAEDAARRLELSEFEADIYRTQLRERYPDAAQFKGLLFSMLIAELIKHDPNMIMNGYKDRVITVYPESIIFYLVKWVPAGWLPGG